MKNLILTLLTIFVFTSNTFSQSKGIRIGYIDMEYILQNVPDYVEAKNQLEQKAQKWKQEIEVKKNEIVKMKESYNSEKVLLTKELMDEREEEIKIKEAELSDFQQKKFGATGDLIVQKTLLVQPIQDQVFTAVQDLAESRKYDFIFDKSSDLTMLFAAKRFNISDQVIKVLTRSNKRGQLTKKQLKEAQAKEQKEDAEDINPELAERRKALEDKKAAREKALADKKLAAEQRKQELEEKKQKAIADREVKKRKPKETNSEKSTGENKSSESASKTSEKQEAIKNAQEEKQLAKAKLAEDRKIDQEERKRIIEEKKQKAVENKEAIKKAKEDKIKEAKDAKEKKN